MSTIFGNLKKLMPSLEAIVKQVADFAYIKDELIAFQQSKLFNEGLDSEGKFLRTDRAKEQGNVAYATFTEEDKQSRGLPYSRVTLAQYQDFYDSMKVIVKDTFYKLDADFNKKDGHIYENFTTSYSNANSFEQSILGLTDEDLQIWANKIFLPQLIKSYKVAILQAIKASK